MKKILIVAAGLLIMGTGAYVAFAQRTPGAPVRPGPGRMQRGAQAMPWKGPMYGHMMRAMTEKQMEVTDNGEVIVMIGCQLFKYDANLQEVARTQVEIDMEAMQRKMQQMMENCPMWQQMQQGGDTTDDNGNQN